MEQKKPDIGNREKIFKVFLYARDSLKTFLRLFKSILLAAFTLTAVLFFLIFTYYIGYTHPDLDISIMTYAFRIILLILFFARLIQGIILLDRKRIPPLILRLTVLIFTVIVILANSELVNSDAPFWSGFYGNSMVITACFILASLEISRLFRLISSVNFPPALIFSTSFLVIILIGSGLLMLPNSRTGSVNYIDALFTSVSAVCVTGLTVVNTSTSFTGMGKMIILCLIQLGGLGMMTFTGFFSYIFTSRSSLNERRLLQDIFSSESLGNLFKILIKIILFTVFIEASGALIIYYSLNEDMTGKGFFSIFHSVSAFCNAGFSTLSDGLMSTETNRNYILLSAISVLVILGGLGFPVMLRLYAMVKNKIVRSLDFILRRRSQYRREWLDPGSKIAIRTTIFLLFAGALIFYQVERNRSMNGLDIREQFFLSFFNSMTARTAGFNMSNLILIGYPAMFLIIFLMWIGASPGSTGGGIKTSTFTIAVRAAWSNIRGRKSLEIANREINQGTINRVLSIITLSIFFIGTGFFILLLSDPDKNPVHLLFECVSAFSTVGLTLADTSTLSHTGKIVGILLMFIGRVGPLTLLTGLFISGRKKYYKYPVGDIAIN